MPSIANPAVLAALVARLERLEPESERRWGTLTAGEMLCHLGDANTGVLRQGQAGPGPAGTRPVLKWLALVSPLRWSRGLKTPRRVDPQADGTRPGDFEQDRARAIASLRAITAAAPGTMALTHQVFGPMIVADWQRWAWKHTDHHLRQFGG
jgi:hypothetical protein